MVKNRGKKVKIEFDELTLWKAGTIIFGILFLLCILKGSDGGNAIPVQPPTVGAPSGAPPTAAPVDVDVGDAYVKGKKNAKVEIIEFSDLECPFCGRFYRDTYGQIVENYIDTGKAKLAFKHLPLPFHNNAQKAAEALECAGEVGGDDAFWDMHDVIFENQQAITVPDLKGYAGQVGVDQSKFDSCLDNGDTAGKIAGHLAEAKKLGASGTPTFFVNGVKLVGAQPYSAFEAAINAAL